jgi:hypothetical protein
MTMFDVVWAGCVKDVGVEAAVECARLWMGRWGKGDGWNLIKVVRLSGNRNSQETPQVKGEEGKTEKDRRCGEGEEEGEGATETQSVKEEKECAYYTKCNFQLASPRPERMRLS